MRGNNPIRQPVQDDGSQLEVKHIFPTLQGEGPYTGVPSVFVRLGGCNLACSFCDTDFEGFRRHAGGVVSWSKLKNWRMKTGKRVRNLVVITGGEPLRQNIVPLCESLLAQGFKVQIETNGTLWRELPKEVDIVCSPKNTGSGYFSMREDLLPRLSALKFIISRFDKKYNHVGDVGQGAYSIPRYMCSRWMNMMRRATPKIWRYAMEAGHAARLPAVAANA